MALTGGGSHGGGWSEEEDTGHVQVCQQAQEQVLLSLGAGHHLEEKAGEAEHQPGKQVEVWAGVICEVGAQIEGRMQ